MEKTGLEYDGEREGDNFETAGGGFSSIIRRGGGGAAQGPRTRGGDEVSAEDVNGIPFIGKTFGELPPKELRDLATEFAQKNADALIAVASAFEGKASVIIAAGKNLQGVDASALIKIAVPVVGGKGGGGKPNFAQCGGSDGDQIGAAIDAIKAALQQSEAV